MSLFAESNPTRKRAQLPRTILIVAMLLFIWYYRDYQPLRKSQEEKATVETVDPVDTVENDQRTSRTDRPAAPRSDASLATRESDSEEEQRIAELFGDRRSDVIVTATAEVVKMLPDDNQGDRHQKMIVALKSGHSLLLSHNIDIAPRVPTREGDTIRFRGEYEYTEQGGVIHWTHHDPAEHHKDGWVEFNGRLYQ